MFELHGQVLSPSYDLRARLLIENKFALWDVLKACRRQGSADSNILSETPNDFNEFLARHPKIRLIAFNGKKAAAFFDSHVDLSIIIRREILPSTSSAVVGNLKCRVFRNEEYNGFGNNQYIDFGNKEYRGSKFSGLIQSDQKLFSDFPAYSFSRLD
jgi:hypoxanthine-DNA glycosylase